MRAWRLLMWGVVGLTLSGCGADRGANVGSLQGPLLGEADRILSIEGLSGPESVRYDPDQDVWFIGNFNGDSGERDANGFVARVSAETGQVDSLHFAVGTTAHPLHAARGMYIVGDTLWVADIDGIHGFDRHTGAQLTFVDLARFEPGFLNDIARGGDGALYVTDTGRSAVYRVAGGVAEEALRSSDLGGPNGITWDPARSAVVLVPWEGRHRVHTWRPGGRLRAFAPFRVPARLDGVEIVDGRLLVASQSDSTLHLLDAMADRPLIKVAGPPADIGVDTYRRRVAVPYVGLDRVDVWALPVSR